MASTVLSTNLLANQDSPFVDYKFLLEKYASPHVIVGYDNDSQCWCFQRRFYVTFKNQLRMLMEDQWGSHLVASEGQETIVEFNESMVIECKSYNAEDFAKPNRPKAGLKHSLVVYYVPKRIVERVGENGATTVKASYPESILIVYPNRRVQNLAEWYVNNARNPKSGRNLYAYNVKEEYWMRKYQYIELEQSHVYGIDDKFEMFERDFNIIHQKIDKLHKVGKSCSLNYFVHGPPGTGKSSFARAIATKYNLDIYTANLKDCQHIKDSDAVKTILTPSKIIFKQDNEEKKEDCDDDCCDNEWCDDDGCETVVNPKQNQYYVVLIEDFDRYLDSCTANEMSNILNSIDGVEPSDGVIRFFSANNTEDIKLNKAFLSRMNGIWHFSLNDKASIKKRVLELFETPLYQENSTEITIQDLYTEKASTYKLSLREITNHLCRFLMDEVNGIKSALEDLDRFVSEKDIKVESDAVVLNSGETAKNQQEKTEESETCEKLE